MLLRVANVTKRFEGLTAIEDCSIDVAEGSIHGLIGPNGAGKTTLFDMISGAQVPTSGRILLGGARIDGRPPHQVARAGIARTFQLVSVFGEMSVLENVMVGMHQGLKTGLLPAALGTPSARRADEGARNAARELLELVMPALAEDRREAPASILAYGEQRLLEITRALASRPRLVLLDEPGAGLNASEKQALKRIIFAIRDQGITVLFVEHDMKLAMGLADRVSVLDHGVKIAEGTAAEVQSDPKVLEAYLGSARVKLLEIRGLRCEYGGVPALRGVDLDVEEGEVVALVGANGAGKTTTLRCTSGLVGASGGEILFGGTSLRGRPPHAIARMGIGHVLEGRHLFPHLTVLENLEMGAHRRGDPAGVARDLAEVQELFPRLAERSRQEAGTLSGGEQQMVAIARALMAGPKLLLMDEPSVGLAPILVRQMFAAIAEIAKRGTTILLVEQNAQMALELADRGCVLELGEIVARDGAETLLRDERVRRSYLGVE